MIAPLIAALLAAAPASDAPQQTALLADSSPASALTKAQNDWEDAQQVYLQSCSDRAYGAYDDLCGQLAGQVKQYRIKLDRLQRAAPRTSGAAASTPAPDNAPGVQR